MTPSCPHHSHSQCFSGDPQPTRTPSGEPAPSDALPARGLWVGSRPASSQDLAREANELCRKESPVPSTTLTPLVARECLWGSGNKTKQSRLSKMAPATVPSYPPLFQRFRRQKHPRLFLRPPVPMCSSVLWPHACSPTDTRAHACRRPPYTADTHSRQDEEVQVSRDLQKPHLLGAPDAPTKAPPQS